MKKKDIKSNIEHRIKRAGESFRKLHSDFDSKAIHDFRVEIKKIRALIRLAAFATKQEKKLKLPKKLKRFYRAVGGIRSCQLHARKISETASRGKKPPPDIYLKLLDGRKEVMIRQAKREKRQLNGIKKEMEKLIRQMPRAMDSDSTKNFIYFELSRLNEIHSKRNPNDLELHEVRKILKDILYNWSFLEPGLISILPTSIQKKKEMEELVNRLGKHQDHLVSLHMFNDLGIDQDADEQERSDLKKIALKWKGEKAHLRKEILATLKRISLNGHPGYLPVSETP